MRSWNERQVMNAWKKEKKGRRKIIQRERDRRRMERGWIRREKPAVLL